MPQKKLKKDILHLKQDIVPVIQYTMLQYTFLSVKTMNQFHGSNIISLIIFRSTCMTIGIPSLTTIATVIFQTAKNAHSGGGIC